MKTILLLTCFLGMLFPAQSFEYDRTWGTYYGPTQSGIGDIIGREGVFINPLNNNVHARGGVNFVSGLSDSYYDQFVTAGGQTVNTSFSGNGMHGVFNTTGNIVSSQYTTTANTGNSNYAVQENLIGFDQNGQGISQKSSQFPLNDTGTSNAWFVNDPNPTSSNYHDVLHKNDVNGNLLWKTYLPQSGNGYLTIQDEANNLYILGTTNKQQGIGTPGTLQPNYDLVYPQGGTEPFDNGYIAKLNSNGQLQWATYFPSNYFYNVAYYNNHLYVLSGDQVNPNNSMATTNTWQTNDADFALTKMDTATGNRVWGTYIGDPSNTSQVFTMLGLQVNNTGVYLSGLEYNFSPNNPNYFATAGSHKPQISGNSDLFLTRLTLDGNRVWGTYFGSDGHELENANNPIAVTDNYIFIAGGSYGAGSNIATSGAFLDTKPNTTNSGSDFFFAKFDINGNQQWCSYYGGANTNPSIAGQYMGIIADGDNRFYLYGATTSATGISTPGTYQPQLPANIGTYTTGFLARFDLRTEMSTAENDLTRDLQLYDNPNNGNFSLNGSVLTKQQCKILLYDTAGRLVYQKELPKQKTLHFQLQGLLSSGNYVLQVNGENNEQLKVFKMVVKN